MSRNSPGVSQYRGYLIVKPQNHKPGEGCYVTVEGHKIKCHTIELAYKYAKKYIDRLIIEQTIGGLEL